MATLDELTAMATAVLGKDRAAALSAALAMRASHADLVRQARAKSAETPSPMTDHRLSASSLAAAAAALDRIAEADEWLRAFASRADIVDAETRQDSRPL